MNRCISRPMDTCGQNKAMEISAADVPWSEGQNPKLVRSFSPQNLKNMDLEKTQIQVGDGSPVPRTLSIIYSGGVIKLSRLSHGPWFSYPLKFRGQFQSFASLSRKSPPCHDFLMEITRFFDQNLGENHDVPRRSSWLRPLRLNFRLPRKAAA